MSETWCAIPDYRGCYEVSDRGRVRSLARIVETKDGRLLPIKACVLVQGWIGGGYRSVGLHKHGVRRTFAVHRLVLAGLVGPRPKGMPHIRHLNGDSTDNRLTNLVYGTAAENAADKVLHGTNRTRIGVATQCFRGHEFTDENTAIQHNGTRRCIACRQRQDRDAKRRQRERRQRIRAAAAA